jgi:hypothetical protein
MSSIFTGAAGAYRRFVAFGQGEPIGDKSLTGLIIQGWEAAQLLRSRRTAVGADYEGCAMRTSCHFFNEQRFPRLAETATMTESDPSYRSD